MQQAKKGYNLMGLGKAMDEFIEAKISSADVSANECRTGLRISNLSKTPLMPVRIWEE